MRILGIDPGTTRLGYGIIDADPTPKYVRCGVLEPTEKGSAERLEFLFDNINRLIEKYKPDCAVVEKLYFSTNKTTAIAVAEARGVILLALKSKNVPITEFTPNQVKSLVTGWGKSDKKSIQRGVELTIKLPNDLKVLDDAMDALALALCGCFTMRGVKKRD